MITQQHTGQTEDSITTEFLPMKCVKSKSDTISVRVASASPLNSRQIKRTVAKALYREIGLSASNPTSDVIETITVIVGDDGTQRGVLQVPYKALTDHRKDFGRKKIPCKGKDLRQVYDIVCGLWDQLTEEELNRAKKIFSAQQSVAKVSAKRAERERGDHIQEQLRNANLPVEVEVIGGNNSFQPDFKFQYARSINSKKELMRMENKTDPDGKGARAGQTVIQMFKDENDKCHVCFIRDEQGNEHLVPVAPKTANDPVAKYLTPVLLEILENHMNRNRTDDTPQQCWLSSVIVLTAEESVKLMQAVADYYRKGKGCAYFDISILANMGVTFQTCSDGFAQYTILTLQRPYLKNNGSHEVTKKAQRKIAEVIRAAGLNPDMEMRRRDDKHLAISDRARQVLGWPALVKGMKKSKRTPELDGQPYVIGWYDADTPNVSENGSWWKITGPGKVTGLTAHICITLKKEWRNQILTSDEGNIGMNELLAEVEALYTASLLIAA